VARVGPGLDRWLNLGPELEQHLLGFLDQHRDLRGIPARRTYRPRTE
jgi:hypothetical protein